MASVAAGRHLVRQPRDVRAETGLAGLRNDYAPCAVVPGLRGRNRRASTSRPNCGDPARQLRAHSYRKYFERLQPQLTAERSEERRVGKECRYGRSRDRGTKKAAELPE